MRFRWIRVSQLGHGLPDAGQQPAEPISVGAGEQVLLSGIVIPLGRLVVAGAGGAEVGLVGVGP